MTPNMPPYVGQAVHYVDRGYGHCESALIKGLTHPASGDDGQWCASVDVFWHGSPQIIKDHVPHGVLLGHWHRTNECPRAS